MLTAAIKAIIVTINIDEDVPEAMATEPEPIIEPEEAA